MQQVIAVVVEPESLQYHPLVHAPAWQEGPIKLHRIIVTLMDIIPTNQSTQSSMFSLLRIVSQGEHVSSWGRSVGSE